MGAISSHIRAQATLCSPTLTYQRAALTDKTSHRNRYRKSSDTIQPQDSQGVPQAVHPLRKAEE